MMPTTAQCGSFTIIHVLQKRRQAQVGCGPSSATKQLIWVLSRFSPVQHFATPLTVARQAPLSMGFSRREYWSGLPCPPPGYLPHPGIEPGSPALRADLERGLNSDYQAPPESPCVCACGMGQSALSWHVSRCCCCWGRCGHPAVNSAPKSHCC